MLEWIILGAFSALAIAALFLPWKSQGKNLILVLLTIAAAVLIGTSLFSSLNEPQFSSRLELFETDLLLQATQAKGDPQLESLTRAIAQDDPRKAALKKYLEARTAVAKEITTSEAQLTDGKATTLRQAVKQELSNQTKLRDELDLRLGVLQAESNDVKTALERWQSLRDRKDTPTAIASTAAVLNGLWSTPPQVLPKAELSINQSLNGWFRFRSLARLYRSQQRSQDLAQLTQQEQAIASQALVKQVTANGLSALAGLAGVGILIFVAIQTVTKGKQSLLAGTNTIRWNVPWDGEVIWQVVIIGFFAIGQLVLQFLLMTLQQQLGLNLTHLDERGKAFYSLGTYLGLSGGALTVLFWSIREYLPLPTDWFRFNLRGNWFLWGVGGWLAAFPLVIVVSLLNQQIWQGRGGSNPLLPIAIESKDSLALSIFFITAAVFAPIFEEIFFRGFLLSSLTKYFSTWQAILISSLLFAAVHLSLSEVLPLMTLGSILAIVYVRSQNLLAPILLHALWNGGTMLTLFLLGSGAA
jgi:hypothetical protein